ncbi:MAG: sulfotransferase [Crocinitomicaceae bacterium]|nr:sulfotransferase [Crocinitomicaceae bacterium]
MEKSNPIFIIGVPRSGTTLLSTMLNVADGIHFPEETHFFIQKSRYHSHSNYFKNKITFGEFYFSKRREYNRKLTVSAELIAEFNLLPNEKEQFEFILNLKGQQKDTVLCEKTPIHMNCIDDIKAIYPNAQFILMIRDPRDVFNSLLKVEWSFLFPYRKRIALFKKLIALSQLENVYPLKYENLILNPKEELSKLCAFLSIDFDEKMYTHFNDTKYSNFDLKHEPWKANNTKQLDPSNLHKWKENNPEFCAYLSTKLKGEIDYFGYESTTVKRKITSSLKFTLKGWRNEILSRVINLDLFLIFSKRY